MTVTAHTVLVVGATGAQGSGVVRALTTLPGTTIHALVRDPSAARSQALLSATSGGAKVKLFPGTFDDRSSIAQAAQGCNVVFINVVPTFADPALELTHVNNILSAFMSNNSPSKWVIYSAGIGSHDYHLEDVEPGLVKMFVTSKVECHKHLVQRCSDSAIPFTILQPGHFFSNWLPPSSDMAYPQLQKEHTLRCAFKPDLKLPCLDQKTLVGDVVAILISDGADTHRNETIPLASAMLTIPQIAQTMTAVLQRHGKEITIGTEFLSEQEAKDILKTGAAPFLASHLYQNIWPTVVDVENIKRLGVELKSFDSYMEENLADLELAVGLA